MAISTTVLFGRPQREIASLIRDRLSKAVSTSIVTGFVTPGGIEAIADPIRARPSSLSTFVIGAATYPGFEALDGLNAAGVGLDRLYVHLGHTRPTGTRKHPFVRYHPMLHSKVYYLEMPDENACAFVGSHNVTTFALTGQNGEAGVLIEGPKSSSEFDPIREHIAAARRQSAPYSPDMKMALAWWTREFLDGLRGEMGIPQDWTTIRTIIIFATVSGTKLPRAGESFYFELPAGIQHIESLKTQVHLFLFGALPADPWQAISGRSAARAAFTCVTLGADNEQGIQRIKVNWQIQDKRSPVLLEVSGGSFQPATGAGNQQVRARIEDVGVDSLEYLFENEKLEWMPIFSDEPSNVGQELEDMPSTVAVSKAERWQLVSGLQPKLAVKERDEAALKLAAPESGSFVLVSLRRRRRTRNQEEPID